MRSEALLPNFDHLPVAVKLSEVEALRLSRFQVVKPSLFGAVKLS